MGGSRPCKPRHLQPTRLAIESELSLEDSLYDQFKRIVTGLIREHSTSYVHYTTSFPCALAGCLHVDDKRSKKSVEYFKKAVEAFNAAQRYNNDPAVKALLKRHPFSGVALKLCIKYAQASGYDLAGDGQFKEWLNVCFRGQLGTVMVENSAKALRDHETRDRPNKVMQHHSSWSILAQSALLKDYGLSGITPGACGSAPDSFDEHVFQPTRANGQSYTYITTLNKPHNISWDGPCFD